MKAIYFILSLSFGLLSIPDYSDAQQPFLLNNSSFDIQSKEYIIVQVATSDSASIQLQSRNLISRLSNEGYFEASIDSIVAINDSSVQIFYYKGPRTKFNEIVDEAGQRYCDYLLNEYYRFNDLEGCLNSIIDSYILKGYPFATVTISNFLHKVDSGLSVIIDVQSGDSVTISSFEYSGNRSLNHQMMSTIARVQLPKRFHPDLISDAITRLNRSEFISEANYAGLVRSDSTYSAFFSIQETRNSTIDLLLGLEPRLNSGYRIVGQGNLQLNHLLAPASRLNLEFIRSGTTESKLGLLYNQYQIAKLPLGYGFGAELRQIDSTYFSIETVFFTEWRIDPLRNIQLGLNYNKVSGSVDLQVLNQLNQNRYGLSVEFNYRTINNWRVPTNGTLLSAKLTTENVNLTDDDLDSNIEPGYSVNQIELKYSRFIPLSQRLVLAPSHHLLYTIQDVYYDIDRIRFGGTNSMRGFREDQFRLAGYSMSTVEGRWMVNSTSYLFTFVSGAYTWTPNELGSRNYSFIYNSIFSGGFGISYRVRPGILNVSYAISNDDTWLNGKVHFGITNSF